MGDVCQSTISLKNGYTSVPTVEGLVWFKPEEIKNPDFSSVFFIDGIYADDSLIEADNKVTLESNTQSLRIDFSTPYWGTSENLF